MHAARPNSRRTKPAQRQAPPTRGVRLSDGDAQHGVPFPDKQATLAEVRAWLREGKLPARLRQETV